MPNRPLEIFGGTAHLSDHQRPMLRLYCPWCVKTGSPECDWNTSVVRFFGDRSVLRPGGHRFCMTTSPCLSSDWLICARSEDTTGEPIVNFLIHWFITGCLIFSVPWDLVWCSNNSQGMKLLHSFRNRQPIMSTVLALIIPNESREQCKGRPTQDRLGMIHTSQIQLTCTNRYRFDELFFPRGCTHNQSPFALFD